MRGGVGGPLLCIGDLLSDVGEEEDSTTTANDIHHNSHHPASVETSDFIDHHIQPSHLTKLFEESYKCLNDALGGTSHSWTAHTLELCLALETANKLIQSSNSHVMDLSQKISELEKITSKGNVVIKEAEFIHTSKDREGSLDSRLTH